MMKQVVVDCKYRYSSGFALDVQFESEQRVTALYGPSGSGKTSVLKLICGLLRPTRGLVCIRGDRLTDTETGVFQPPESRQLGMVFQQHCLFPHLSVKANIQYGARRRKLDLSRFSKVVETLELGDLLGRYPLSLSGGQQQRVGLARALVASPRMLLLDEPLNAVEEKLKNRIAQLIARVIREFEIPALVVSHDQNLVDRLADEVVILDNGRSLREKSGAAPNG